MYSYGGYQSRFDENKEKDMELEIKWNHKLLDSKYLQEILNKCKTHDKSEEQKTEFQKLAKQYVNLDDCFERFRQPEQLAEDNTWYCNQCKEHVQAFKKLEIYKAPPILVLSLKRFKSSTGYFSEKYGELVEFPIRDLDMNKYCIKQGDMTYDF